MTEPQQSPPKADANSRVLDWLRRLKHVPDQVLHRRRRTDASNRLRPDLIRPGPVLFLCHGNICRSPFAAANFDRAIRTLLAPTFQSTSAGFIGAGRPCPPDAIAAAAEAGLDLSRHRSRLVTPDDVRAAVLIVVMSAEQAAGVRARFSRFAPPVIVLGDLDPLPIATRAIRDPWNAPRHVFDECYDRIDRCVGALAGLLAGFQ